MHYLLLAVLDYLNYPNPSSFVLLQSDLTINIYTIFNLKDSSEMYMLAPTLTTVHGHALDRLADRPAKSCVRRFGVV